MAVFDGVIPAIVGAANAAGGYDIQRSLRFNSADTAYLDRTPSSATNRRTYTFSCWVKRSQITSENIIFHANSFSWFRFESSQKIYFWYDGSNSVYTDAVFRDVSAWYHLVLAVDTTQATASDRVKIYVNGVQQTLSGTQPTQNFDTGFNNNIAHYIGRQGHNTSNMFNGYLAEVHFVDGQQLAATDFGEYSSNSIWRPKEYSGTYGTNGFYLKFDDNSSDAALGTDSSGNNNTWTVNNIDATGSSGTEVTAAWAGYVGSWSTSDTWNSLSDATTNFGNNGGVKGYSTTTETWAGAKSITVGDFGSSNRGGNGWALRYPASTTITINPGAQSYLTDLVVCPNESTAISAGTSVTTFPATVTGQVFWLRYTGAGYPAVDAFGTVTNPLAGTPDSVIDSPTNYTADSGNNGGNYCTWNSLSNDGNSTLSDGNLQSEATAVGGNTFGTIKMPDSGKYYWECEITALNTIAVAGFGLTLPYYSGNYIVSVVGIWYVASTGNISYNSTQVSYGATFGLNDIIGIAVDCDDNTIEFFKNGVSQGEADPSAYGLNVTDYVPGAGDSSGAHNNTIVGNFGQQSFSYTPPTGHVSLCTKNLPNPTIANGSTAMDVVLWTGDGTSSRSVDLPISGDLVWAKKRSAIQSHQLADTVRGSNSVMKSNSTDTETDPETGFTGGGISSISSTAFTISQGTSTNDNLNQNSGTFVAWTWDAGTSTVSNTDGSITSNVRANTSAGFSIVGYTGTGSAATIGHGLNAAPEFIILKNRDTARPWSVFHQSIANMSSGYINLNSTSAFTGSYTGVWNGTDPTSSVFSVGTDNESNNNGDNFIAYCWTPVSQYSSFGTYTGNGSSDGPFVFTGFRPALVICKASSTTSSWNIFDSTRAPFNVVKAGLLADSTAAEFSSSDRIDIVSNGFKVRSGTSEPNANGVTYVYMAWAEHPFATTRAR